MRIHHVVASVLPEYGGPSYSVPALCNALTELGHEVTLHTFAPVPAFAARRFELETYHWQRWLARSAGLSWDMPGGLRRAAQSGEVMHVHGLWMLPNLLPALAVLGSSCALAWSPRGMLDAWSLAQSAQRKRLLWSLAQGPAVRSAALLHATAQREADSLRQLRLTAPIARVANGMEIPGPRDVAHHRGVPRTLLFLSRLHPKKGIAELLRAWARVQDEAKDWRLDVVGPDNDGYLVALTALAAELQLQRVRFLPAAYAADKVAHLREAQLYVLPSHSENFGLGVAEALAHGLPVLVGRGTPWSEVVRERVGWHVDNDVDTLVATLRDALFRPPEALHAMGQRGRAFISRVFSWRRCAHDLSESYAWVRYGGSVPSCIV